jgi:putative ABC transport system permease protein
MRMFGYVWLAFRSLRLYALRSLVAILGIAIGIATVLDVVAVAEGARSEVSRQINSLGSCLILVVPGAQLDHGVRKQAGSMQTLSATDARALARQIPGIVIAAPFVDAQMTAVSGNLNWSTLIAGITPAYFDAREWTPAHGQLFKSEDQTKAAKVAVIGHTVSRELFGNEDSIGRLIRVGRTSYTVIGVLAQKGQDFTGRDQDDVIFIPLVSAKIFTVGRNRANPDAVHSILIKASSEASMAEAEPMIARVLRQRHKLADQKRDDFEIQNLVQVVQTRDKVYRQFTLLVSMLAGISLLVGGIGVMNVMLMAVAERTTEIGVRFVIGARPGDIRKQFLFEASLLCAIGGVLGLLAGYGVACTLAAVFGWTIEFSLVRSIVAVGFATLIGLVAGIIPAERASRLDPAGILRLGQ